LNSDVRKRLFFGNVWMPLERKVGIRSGKERAEIKEETARE